MDGLTLANLSPDAIAKKMNGEGLSLAMPPFDIRIRSRCPRVQTNLLRMYGEYSLSCASRFVDFDVSITHQRSWFKPQSQFYFDDYPPFLPLPAAQDYAILEWGLNWCVANHANEFLILHSAVVAHQQRAILLPGFPGAGKSTLTCELMLQGWQLLSDELALITNSLQLIPTPRPVSLKNQSIEVIHKRHPNAIFTDPVYDTAKGTVAHVKPSSLSLELAEQPATPYAVVFPKFKPGSELVIEKLDPAYAMITLAEQGFNYHILGSTGFERLSRMIDQLQCYQLSYSSLDEAVEWFELLKSADHVDT